MIIFLFNMKKNLLFLLTILSTTLLTACVTKTVLVKCPDSGAKITVDGDYAGGQEATFKMKHVGWKNVIVSAPKYITESFTMRPNSSDITEVCLKLDPKYAERNYTIKTIPEDAIIAVDGDRVAQGTYSFSMDRDHFLEADVSRQGYFSSMVRINGTDKPGIVTVTLIEDDAWIASAPASDIANKNIRFRATSNKDDDEIWYTLIRYASDFFGDYTVNDKGAGWAKSTWVYRTFSKIKVRSRLEIKRNPGDKKEFTIYLASEYTTKKDCSDDECFKPWDRVLKTYVELPSALSTGVQ